MVLGHPPPPPNASPADNPSSGACRPPPLPPQPTNLSLKAEGQGPGLPPTWAGPAAPRGCSVPRHGLCRPFSEAATSRRVQRPLPSFSLSLSSAGGVRGLSNAVLVSEPPPPPSACLSLFVSVAFVLDYFSQSSKTRHCPPSPQAPSQPLPRC